MRRHARQDTPTSPAQRRAFLFHTESIHMSTRIYLVTDQTTQAQRLIEAAHQAQAIRHVAQKRYSVRVARQSDLIALLPNGAVVECAETTETTGPADAAEAAQASA